MSDTSPLEYLYTEEIYAVPSRVMVIIPQPWDDVNDADRQLLGKILGAVKMSLAAVHVIVAKEFDLRDVQLYSPRYIITFGSALKTFRNTYEIHAVDGTTVLQADRLDQLDDTKKKSLWSALRIMFNP
ncbi:MAG TPA: hypothetical protein VK666_09175 [Chryseolinea sp.]|nr:hypothetical protein [Chryseolinea sp.]